MKTSIREPDDGPTILRRATYEEARGIDLWDEYIGDRRVDNSRGELIVAAQRGEVIGYVHYSSNLFYNRPFISLLCVKESCRRTGVGQRMVERVLEIYEGLEVWISTEDNNEPAARLFAKLHFRKMGGIRGLNVDGSEEIYFVHDGRILGENRWQESTLSKIQNFAIP